jgi:glycosyltransferase involved in cell wall biosynthesis
MSFKKDSVSFVFPVYNEGNLIERTLLSYYKEFNGKLDFEIIVAEDGSTDSTKSVLAVLGKTISAKVFSSCERKGYLRAIKEVLCEADGEWIFLVDSDNQFDPKDFWKLWAYREEYDIVLGRKIRRKDGLLRSFLSIGYNFLIRSFLKVSFRDVDTGFRLIRKVCLSNHSYKVKHLQFFTAEFVVRAFLGGAKVMEVPVQHFSRENGRTNIFYLRKLPGIIFVELLGIVRLARELRTIKHLGG